LVIVSGPGPSDRLDKGLVVMTKSESSEVFLCCRLNYETV